MLIFFVIGINIFNYFLFRLENILHVTKYSLNWEKDTRTNNEQKFLDFFGTKLPLAMVITNYHAPSRFASFPIILLLSFCSFFINFFITFSYFLNLLGSWNLFFKWSAHSYNFFNKNIPFYFFLFYLRIIRYIYTNYIFYSLIFLPNQTIK